MENSIDIAKICYGCLRSLHENKLFKFDIENGPLQSVFQVNTINLCYLCKRSAEKLLTFIQNVQSNQLLLENIHVLMDSTLQSMKAQVNPLLNLNQVTLDCIDLFDNVSESEETFIVFGFGCKQTVIKAEMKEEYAEPLEEIDKDFTNDGDADMKEEYTENREQVDKEFSNDEDEYPDRYFKEEDKFPLNELLKTDIQVKDIGLMSLKDLLKQTKPMEKDGTQQIEKIFLTTKQCMDERDKLTLDQKYQEFTYKCNYCIKGFENRLCFDRHMDKHSETAGDFVCEICNMRKETSFKLARHRSYHIIRYKCTECGLIRNNRATIKDHYNAYHAHGYHQFNCPHCPKNFKLQVSLKKHIWYAHKTKGKVTCAYCHKTYAHKEVLKVHMMTRHAENVSSSVEKPKRWVCKECGAGFKCPSHLKKHNLKHVHTKDFYCVECDK